MKDSGVEWMGEIPEHWNTKKLKHITNCLDSKRIPLNAEERGNRNGSYPYYGASGLVDYVNEYIFDEKLVCLAEDGENLRSRILPISFIIEGKTWVNNHAHVLRPNNVNAEYLTYLLNSMNVMPYLEGATRMKLNQDRMNNFLLSCPPVEEQKLIVEFLDKKTEQIDSIIAKKQRLAEILLDKRNIIINQTVTKGLNVNTKMKNSNVEWIGKIPEHWEVSKIKYSAYVKGRIGWQGLRSDEFIDEGPYLITGTDFKDGKINWNDCYHVELWRYEQDPYIQIKNNDLLITKDGTIGKVALVDNVPAPTTLNTGVMVIRPMKNTFIANYMFWILQSEVFKQYINYIKTGTTIQHLYQETFNNFIFPLPKNFTEQKFLSDFLYKEIVSIDFLINKTNKQIEKLQEYRQALISNVVTGKIDVRK